MSDGGHEEKSRDVQFFGREICLFGFNIWYGKGFEKYAKLNGKLILVSDILMVFHLRVLLLSLFILHLPSFQYANYLVEHKDNTWAL